MNEPNEFPAVIYRSRDDRVLAGVVGGFARRWGVSSTRLRVAYVLLSIASAAFPGIILYIVLWFLFPEERPS